MKTHRTKNETETQALAEAFARSLKGGEVVELVGDLGSGKTTFVRGVAKALGATAKVKSPTFTVMNEYPIDHGTLKRLVHLDLYRFNNPSQLEALALGDYRRADTVIFIEWPDIFVKPAMTADRKVEFIFIDDHTRDITL